MLNMATSLSERAKAPAVTIAGLRVARGGVPVLRGLDLTMTAGRITGLLGPSGSGKTTLMRCILGLQAGAVGDVTVLGCPAGDPELRRRIGYVTQAPSVYPDLTVAENITYFARILAPGRTSRSQIAKTVDEAVATVGLTDHAGQLAGRLSGGQLSRVSLATALIGSPELLVLDEPTVGLDPVLRASLWDVFAALAAQGAAVIVSSHVMDEATRCDDLILLREGRIVFRDTPAALLAQTGCATADAAFLALAGAEAGA